ncbi:MAG: YtxH domain-containing protein [Eggerthellaceae bacterium]|nr:YtxH domain-containing protein [Eggerthellaceae bacterium]
MANKIGSFIVGSIAGAVVALMFAPRKGAETRQMVADRANVAWGEAQEWGTNASANVQHVYQQAAEKGQEIISEVASKSQAVYGEAAARVQQAAESAKPVVVEKNDELREKIEAARQRIAAQVAKNAEESSAAAAETIDAVAEVAQDAVVEAEVVAEVAAEVIEPVADEQK